MLGSLTIVTLVVAVWRPPLSFRIEERPPSRIIPLEGHQLHEVTSAKVIGSLNQVNQPSIPDRSQYDLHKKTKEKNYTSEYIVTSGDTLDSILTQYGIDAADVMMLVKQNSALTNLKIGQSLSWELNSSGNLKRLTWTISHDKTRIYERVDNVFKENITGVIDKWHHIILTGQLSDNFITSAYEAGLTNSDINAVIKALQWQLDFRKLRKGDQFSVLILRKIVDDKHTRSQLLGVRLRTAGKDYYAFRAEDGNFYDRDAYGLTRDFMRFPTLKKFRVSSDFNPRRLNPITGRITPHCGVDFAVPVGTPVLAVGDGEVIVSKMDSAAGNYVAIRHGREYITRYMHLNKLLVKRGQKVKRGDHIALSGSTGRSTGPHLHYEFWINQKAVNPLTVKLPLTKELTGKNREEYLFQVQQILPQLQLN